MSAEFEPTERSRARRRPDRVRYDRAAVFAVLDASLLCHVGYVVDGEPFVTPTAFWREGDTLFWHGSRDNRMIAAVTGRGARACVTVSHLDGLIAGRSGKATSVQYRSVMAFGDPVASTEREAKRHAMNALVDRIYPGRSAELRPALDEELDQITVVSMVIEEASVKAKSEGVIEMQESDYEVPVWAGVIPVRTCVGAIQPDTRLESGIAIGDDIEPYREGARLDDALTQTSASKAG